MRAQFINIVFVAIKALLLTIGLLATEGLYADWGGTLSGSAASSTIDTTRSTSYEQQYTLFTSGQPTHNIRYSLSGLFRHLQSNSGTGVHLWTTEYRPTGSINWTMPLLDMRGDGSYRSDRDKTGTMKMTAGAASLRGQTIWTGLPRLFASWSWAKNVNDLDLLGYDTRTRSLSAGANYSAHSIYANYEYTDLLVRNAETDLDRVSLSHNGRLDLTRSAFDRVLNLSASYQASTRKETDNSTFTGEALVVIRANAGLYTSDPSPDFDPLDTAPALVDGLIELPAGENYDLVNGETHNFGLDFGQQVAIDHLHLYVDSLAALPLTWSIWQSSDNLNWTPILSGTTAPFSTLFLRYEFAFTEVQTRYIKVTVSPQLLNTPLHVTELRGLITRSEFEEDDRTTDQRVSSRILLTPSEWLSWDFSGDALRQSATLTSLAREEDGLQTSLRLDPSNLTEFVSRYSWSRSNYTETGDDFTYSTSGSAMLRSTWSRALTTMASASRTEERDGEFLQRRNDWGRIEARTILLPALRVTTHFIYGEDQRFDDQDKIFSRSYMSEFEGEPTDRSQVTFSYRYESRSARVSAVRKYQTTLGGRLNYRLTETINLTGNATSMTDPLRQDRSYDGIVSWTPTYKISLGGSFNRIEGNQDVNSSQYSIQAVYNWSIRTELTASYAINEREGEDTSSSGRVSLFTRF
ncbi:hypothetical protein HUU59_05995 [bacterium]|nr:hypothetical protein [bacterium]